MDTIRVLIVDDHRVFAEALTLAMASETDIQIVGEPVLTGGDAARVVVEQNADVVLMDLNLPDKDGIEATREVKQARPETKVVILSADPPEARLAEAAEAGASGYLTKTRAVADVADSARRPARSSSPATCSPACSRAWRRNARRRPRPSTWRRC
jgi:two-component system response regulator DegU